MSSLESLPIAGVGAPTATEARAVKFTMSGQEASRTQWRWSGKGTLRDGAQVTLTGKRARPFLWARPQQVTFDRDRIEDVLRTGKRLTCVVVLDNGKREPLALGFESEEVAAAVAHSWPGTRSPEFVEQLQFGELLAARGTRALVTPVMAALCVLLFLFLATQGVNVLRPQGAEMIRWGTNFGPLTLNGEPWRLFTSMFLHFGPVHLILNIVALLSVGMVAEKILGNARFAFLYLCAGLAGSLASLIWNPEVNSAGASGAIFGVFGAWLALMLTPETGIPPTVARKNRNAALTLIAINVLYGFTHPGIDNAAHIGGLLMGFALGWVLARPLGKPEEGPEGEGQHRDWINAWAVAIVVLYGAATYLRIPSAAQPLTPEFNAAMATFVEKEKVALRQEQELNAQAKALQMSNAEWARRSLSEVRPLWVAAQEALPDMPPTSERLQSSTFSALERYVSLRVLRTELYAEAVVEDRKDKEEWAREIDKSLAIELREASQYLLAIRARCEREAGQRGGTCPIPRD